MTRNKSLPIKSAKESKELIDVALGREYADLAIINADLLNVYTGELLDQCSIHIKGKWIAYVGKDTKERIGKKTKVINAEGKTVVPGFIDGHTHLAWMYSVSEFLKYAMKGGTTTIVTETLEPFPVSGYEGVIDFLDSLKDQPIKILATAPAMVSISQTTRGISIETLKKLLARDDIIGLGESYWQAAIQEPDQMLPIYEETLLSGKSLEGHSAGSRDKKLMAYLSTGISSCHEPITAGEVLERIRLGLYVMIREGSIRRDLEEISKIKNSGVNLRRLILVTDGVEPVDLIEKGYMEFIVQKAIDCGFDPVSAVQMATLNVAEHFSLDHLIGGIAPGRYADLLIIPDPETIEAQYVISNGRIIAQDGNLLQSPRKHIFSENSLKSVHLPRELEPVDFIIHVKESSSKVEVRVIDQITDLVTRELKMTLPVIDKKIRADINQDILKVAAVDRTRNPGKMFVGLIKGFCMKSGAIACSAAWDTSDIIVVGVDNRDMAYAVNRIHALQGGAVVCDKQKILAELSLPVFGVTSDIPMDVLAQRLKNIKKAASDLGVPFANPLLTLITLTGAAIPYLRICEEGLVNLKDGKTLNLIC